MALFSWFTQLLFFLNSVLCQKGQVEILDWTGIKWYQRKKEAKNIQHTWKSWSKDVLKHLLCHLFYIGIIYVSIQMGVQGTFMVSVIAAHFSWRLLFVSFQQKWRLQGCASTVTCPALFVSSFCILPLVASPGWEGAEGRRREWLEFIMVKWLQTLQAKRLF